MVNVESQMVSMNCCVERVIDDLSTHETMLEHLMEAEEGEDEEEVDGDD